MPLILSAMAVWLLRESSVCDGPDPYETALSEAGIDFASLSVLQSASCGQDRLAFLISRGDSYDALVFTSHRAVLSLSEVKDAFGLHVQFLAYIFTTTKA